MEEKHILVCCISFKRQRHNVGQACFVRHCILAYATALMMQRNLNLQHTKSRTTYTSRLLHTANKEHSVESVVYEITYNSLTHC